MNFNDNSLKLPRVFIVGGGFAGLEAAKRLASAPVQVTLVDSRNYHLFQPLLYQVATATLSPADIAAPIRKILRDVANCRVVLAKVRGVDLVKKRLLFDRAAVEYDWLILAAGATHSYFGNDSWAPLAPGLKSIEDATEIRRRILLAFESAEYEGSDEQRKAVLTFAIVGGGPTGVELAGAIQEIAAQTIPEDFRYIDTTTTRVVLIEGGDRLLKQFPPELSERAKTDLEKMGVEVMLNVRATDVTAEGLRVNGELLSVKNIFWAAGVQGNPLGKTLGVPTDKAGRVVAQPDLSVPGFSNVFVVGDMAAATSNNEPVPGLAQAAIQMGRYVADIISEETKNGKPSERKPFQYFNKGIMATIGRTKAVAAIGKLRFVGVFAWLMWGLIHILFLIGFRNRVVVLIRWFWNWLFFARDARLITGDARMQIKTPRPGEVVFEEKPPEPAAAVNN